jgi:hypothetical protein
MLSIRERCLRGDPQPVCLPGRGIWASGQEIYAATNGGGVSISLDGGTSWTSPGAFKFLPTEARLGARFQDSPQEANTMLSSSSRGSFL